MDAESELVEKLRDEISQLDQVVENLEAENNQLKGERAILVEGLNSLKWTLDLTLKRFEDRQKSE
jgi:FtsZ-binding cell division protein ZapB